MSILKLKIREKTLLEQLFDVLTESHSDWRDQTLYGWLVHEPLDLNPDFDPMKVYPKLKDFDVRDVNGYTLYSQGDKFLVTSRMTLFTNMEPRKNHKFYDPDKPEIEIGTGDVFRVR